MLTLATALDAAPRPSHGGSVLPEYDAHALVWEINGHFPSVYSGGMTFEQWRNHPNRTSEVPSERDFWRADGWREIQRQLEFVRETNRHVFHWYNRVTDFALNMLDGLLRAQDAVITELQITGGRNVPEVIQYLEEWREVGRNGEKAIRTANQTLQRQLEYHNGLLHTVARFADTLGESVEAEIADLRAQVRELEEQVFRLLEENNKLRARISELEAQARRWGLNLPGAEQWMGALKKVGIGAAALLGGAVALRIIIR
jgi:hypothetical protein